MVHSIYQGNPSIFPQGHLCLRRFSVEVFDLGFSPSGIWNETKPEYFTISVVVGYNIWVWLKIKQEGLRRFWSMFPLTRVPFWHGFFEPQPYIYIYREGRI